MGKKRNKPQKRAARNNVESAESHAFLTNVEAAGLRAEDIKEGILLALREYDREKNSRKSETHQGQRKWWKSAWIIMCMPFARKKTIEGNETLKFMASLVLALLFDLLRWFMILVSVASIGAIIHISFEDTIDAIFALKALVLFVVAFISYLFAGVFRRVSVEVENIKDENILFAFFAAVGTWVSIIIALVALFKKMG